MKSSYREWEEGKGREGEGERKGGRQDWSWLLLG